MYCQTFSTGFNSGALVLQLSLRVGFALMALPVTVLGHGLMDAPPQRPAEEMIEHYAGGTLQAANELADLAHAEGDQRSRLRSPLLCDVTALSFTRRAARKPNASMASVMCRDQPCQERISKSARPTSCLATSKHTSMAQRRPATCARVVRVVR